jgi:hypothetical protein
MSQPITQPRSAEAAGRSDTLGHVLRRVEERRRAEGVLGAESAHAASIPRASE